MLANLKNIAHLIRIARTLARHDALFPVELLNIQTLTFIARAVRRRRKDLTQGQRLAAAFTELGPTFIKLGQGLSTRSDLIGENMAVELAVLQDNLPPFSSETARNIIESQLEVRLSDIFSQFDEQPVAAASIAQVHFATLKNGDDVAVKILRPNIAKRVARDLQLFYWIAGLIEKRNPDYAERLKPVQVVETLEETVKIELDLRMEAASASKLRENFVGWEGFYVPKIYWQHTASQVLVMERVGGLKINDRKALQKSGFDPDEILRNSSQALFKQVFDDGFFHADLHPGNVFVNDRGEIVPIDFGIMGHVDLKSRAYVAEILAGFLTRDYMKVARAHFNAGYVPKHKSIEAFALACRAVGEPVMDLPINEISLARLLGQMFKVAEDFEMQAQPHLLLLQKTMMMSEGVGRALNPEVNMWKLAEPLVLKWVHENMGPKAKLQEVLENAQEIALKIPEIIKKLDAYLDKELARNSSAD
ncbi:MAG: 2-polyprenylphenol 6-hydroxylase [Alphaproteobacteria bacterium CG11_big_fil_rev_8_21_14_0_20_44_7]|nr:MAG: 2-polyprenylphenol 6-hydroxylase [Alphaproteobacteria bacterium CG11_big_fil_rev_8_21_14_0_20_44_7]